MGNMKLTSIKLLDDIYKKFKVLAVYDNITIQKLVNRSMELYINEEKYREMILKHDRLSKVSGSKV